MYLDKLIIENLPLIGRSLLDKNNLERPKNTKNLFVFFELFKRDLQERNFEGLFLGSVLFNFVTSDEVSKRKTTSRVFEDIFASLFSTSSTDVKVRQNPTVPAEIKKLDILCKNLDWTISDDLSSNKREKSDIKIDNYNVSVKTLIGPSYNHKGIIIDKNENEEVNVGSFSFRALLIGIIPDSDLNKIKDRKGGLGSSKQIREKVLNVIKSEKKENEFLERLRLFLNYVYTEDILIVQKSNYRIKFYLVSSQKFVETLLKTYVEKENRFEEIWYRWENNNLRLRWKKLLLMMNEFNFEYNEIEIDLSLAIQHPQINSLFRDVKEVVTIYLKKNIKII
jgi:hypothetical protein